MTEWKEFEEAVASFIAAIGPGAKVSHDVMIPDKDTGRPRQRDVWVEARLFGLFDVKILISCKLWNRPLNSQDIDAFMGELLSAGAQKGVVYSQSGFTRPALEKAAANNISCCKLYRNEAADIPEILMFTWYCCVPQIQLGIDTEMFAEIKGMTFGELFQMTIEGEGGSGTVLDALVGEYERAENQAMDEARRGRRLPETFRAGIGLAWEEGEKKSGRMQLAIRILWRIYRSRVEAHLIEGTYAFGEKRFIGTQYSPVIDMSGTGPGPGWVLIAEESKEVVPPYAMCIIRGDAKKTLASVLGDTKIEDIFKGGHKDDGSEGTRRETTNGGE